MKELKGSDDDRWTQKKGRREYIEGVVKKINIIMNSFDSCRARDV